MESLLPGKDVLLHSPQLFLPCSAAFIFALGDVELISYSDFRVTFRLLGIVNAVFGPRVNDDGNCTAQEQVAYIELNRKTVFQERFVE